MENPRASKADNLSQFGQDLLAGVALDPATMDVGDAAARFDPPLRVGIGVRPHEVLGKEQVEEFAELIARQLPRQLPRLTYDLLHCHGNVFENAGLSGVGNFRG